MKKFFFEVLNNGKISNLNSFEPFFELAFTTAKQTAKTKTNSEKSGKERFKMGRKSKVPWKDNAIHFLIKLYGEKTISFCHKQEENRKKPFVFQAKTLTTSNQSTDNRKSCGRGWSN
jgi:hypothetical protein